MHSSGPYRAGVPTSDSGPGCVPARAACDREISATQRPVQAIWRRLRRAGNRRLLKLEDVVVVPPQWATTTSDYPPLWYGVVGCMLGEMPISNTACFAEEGQAHCWPFFGISREMDC